SHDDVSVSSNFWSIGDSSTYQITAKASDIASGVRELRALINHQGSNSANKRGNFSWRDQSLGYLWTADQVPCSGGGWASKRPDAFNPHTITLVGCSTTLVGNQRTVVFTVRPEASFGEFGPINDISLWAMDFRTLQTAWLNFDLNFASGVLDPAKIQVLNDHGGAMGHNGWVRWGEVELGSGNGVEPKTFTVKNIAPAGSSNLVLEHDPSNIQLTGSTAFSISGTLDSPLAAGESDTFEIELDTDRVGTHTGQLQIWHSDPLRPLPLRINLEAKVLAEPVVNSTTPDVIFQGSSPVLTFRGQHLQGATVYVATEPYEEGTSPSRGYPTAELVSINGAGTELRARIRAQGADVEGFYNLAIETAGGATGGPFRVVTPAPVVDVFTPSQPVQGEIHVMTITGVNLSGADIVPMSSQVKVLDLDNSDDRSLMGTLYVESGGPVGPTDIMIEGPGGIIQIPLRIVGTQSKATVKTEALDFPGRSEKAGV
ncbi:MAG: hypothetical protein MI919_05555, partial [Holophagales bacterium]|nr:hypothetical protein [Holophagales bacterium]